MNKHLKAAQHYFKDMEAAKKQLNPEYKVVCRIDSSCIEVEQE